MKDTFKCNLCGGVFPKGWSEDEALAEMHEHFGESIQPEECAIVCDSCFQKIHPDKHPHLVEQTVADAIRAREGDAG